MNFPEDFDVLVAGGGHAAPEPALAAAPEINPPADAPAPEFIPTCSPEATALIDKVWTKLMN